MASNSVFRQFLLDVLELLGLGTQAGGAAASAQLRGLQNDSFLGAQTVPLSPAEAAVATVKNEAGGLDMAHEAALNGVDRTRFAVMVATAGNPPGPAELLTMLNRGIIDGPRVVQGIREGLIKDEWATALLALQYAPLPAAEAVQALVQGHIPETEARSIWAQQGLLPEHFDVAFETAGNPPGPTETLTMLDRGIFDRATATQALMESRLKDKYIPAFLQLARRRIPFRTLNTLVRNKAISVEYALQQLEQLGYTEADADALIKSAQTANPSAHHDLTVAQVVALYEAHKLTATEATAHLTTVGYTPEVAGEILQLGDVRALLRLRDQVVSALRTRFVGHRIDEATVRADLAKAGVPGDQQDQLLTLWTIEQTANPRELTETQLRHMAGANLITVGDYTARLVGMGYTSADADLLTRLNFPPVTGP